MEFVTGYGPKRKAGWQSDKPSRTKQAHKDECDIKFILSRFEKTGVITHQARHQGSYGEFEPIDFHDAMNIVTQANEMFATLPANVRKQFGNDAGAFLDFANDPENAAALVAMGLGKSPPAEEAKAESPTPSPTVE